MMMSRLSAAIIAWRDCLIGQTENVIDTSMDTAPIVTTHIFKPGGTPEVEVIYIHSLNVLLYDSLYLMNYILPIK